ncbi:MAG: hypothetical protein HYZ29_35965 [Myxococcales bacterium]|nr:hypothetical protein [Myxococcales bacterium]
MVSTIRRWGMVWLLVVACTLAGFAGCGGGDDGGTASNAGAGGGKSDSGTGGDSTGGGLNIDGAASDLSVEPATATLTVTAKGAPQSQAFKASVNGSQVSATWSLASYDIANIDAQGLASSTGITGGKVQVIASYGGKTATAMLTIDVKLSEDVDPNLDAANKAALGGPPSADPGPTVSKFLYPYDQTVMPKGLLSPLVMISAGSVAPVDGKVKISAPLFTWEGYYKVAAPATPRFKLPQEVWNAALATAAGGKLSIEVTKAAGGQAYGPYTHQIVAAPGSLKGAVTYMTYEAPNTGLWAVRPGNTDAPKQIKKGCVVCHSVAAYGGMLSTGAEVNVQSAESGVYQIDLAGNATQISQSPAGLGGDTRGLSFGTWAPNGKYVMRSQNDFWGGPNQLAWKVDVAGKKLDPATVVGLGAGVSAYLPAISHDGKRYAFTQGNGEASPPGSVSRSIQVMDLNINDSAGANGTLTFTNRQVVLDNGASGKVTKYTTFLPDSNYLVLQESATANPGFGLMLPTWDASSTSGGSDGRLHLIDIANKGHVELANANTGNVPNDAQHNYEPFALPVPAGGYYWVVFTSTREYGNVYQGAQARKQLWVAAITPGGTGDPSHPAFYLPNQTESRNERGFWALDPCKPLEASCETGDECCEGFCVNKDPKDPTSPKVCGNKSGCSQIGDKCVLDGDCCASAGTKCLGGYCTQKTPQ